MSRRSLLKGALTGAAGLATAVLGTGAASRPDDVHSAAARSFCSYLPGLAGDGAGQAPAFGANGLRAAANARGLTIGGLPSYPPFFQPVVPPAYTQLLVNQFNLLGTGLGWPSQRPVQPDGYWQLPYRSFDTFLAFAAGTGQRTRCTALFWGDRAHLPAWLIGSSYSRADLVRIVQDRAQAVVGHYAGRVHEWVAVNEAFHISTGDFWADAIGADYPQIVFESVRAADPAAKLIYNDYGNEVAGAAQDRDVTEISKLQTGGLVDAAGLQMHVSAKVAPTPAALSASIERFHDAGVDVLMTECDVNMRGVAGPPSDRLASQAAVYRSIFAVVRDSRYCHSITVQNPGDQYSWLELAPAPPFGGPDAIPTMWDDDLTPKPAYFAVLESLKREPPRCSLP